ncbi:hypothetical protein FB451DRAFT_1228881 [Mycena latifolia]|nr:hypothetical protein FB451DRAFT_1228881 [Mycena latifolia]
MPCDTAAVTSTAAAPASPTTPSAPMPAWGTPITSSTSPAPPVAVPSMAASLSQPGSSAPDGTPTPSTMTPVTLAVFSPATAPRPPAVSITLGTTPAQMTPAAAPVPGLGLTAAAPAAVTRRAASLATAAVPSTSAPVVMACPAKAPTWFAEAHAAMTRTDLGCHFHAVVGSWIGAGRGKRGGAAVEVTDPVAYAVEWQGWWDSLEPGWRRRDADGRWNVVNGYGEKGREWGPLYRWGVNGMLSVVASLYFWGCAVREKPELRETWEVAVGDVAWMMEGMAVYYEMFKGKF